STVVLLFTGCCLLSSAFAQAAFGTLEPEPLDESGKKTTPYAVQEEYGNLETGNNQAFEEEMVPGSETGERISKIEEPYEWDLQPKDDMNEEMMKHEKEMERIDEVDAARYQKRSRDEY
ncbi:MAG: hypothetical protein GY729_08865, partial [Desulfobacteraceae bacterium]|nr:hypothetical protein [Desulfobacteraceae bacterium]